VISDYKYTQQDSNL